MAEIFPIFHSSGYSLLCRLILNIFPMVLISFLLVLSGVLGVLCLVGNFAICNDSIFFLILSFEIFTSFNTASNFVDGTSGTSFIFSLWRHSWKMIIALDLIWQSPVLSEFLFWSRFYVPLPTSMLLLIFFDNFLLIRHMLLYPTPSLDNFMWYKFISACL